MILYIFHSLYFIMKNIMLFNCCKTILYKYDNCICNDIKVIQKFIKKWNCKIDNLESIRYNKLMINYHDIYSFNVKKKADNDNINKIRENIIGAIINNKIPSDYYKYSLKWKNMKKQVDLYITKLCEINNIDNYNTINCIHKAGRSNHYDFKLLINKTKEFYVEFKFNAVSVNDTPQFVSPMRPSQYLEKSYEEYYYDNYLTNIVKEYDLPLPDKNKYLQQIHSINPACLIKHQKKYYQGCKNSSKYTANENDITFYEKMKIISTNSINNFITKYNLKITELSSYLLNTQKDKCYMLFKNNKLYLETINQDNYIIKDFKKEPKLNRYIATTKNDKTLKILLRWKNGNGIAYPAFQIS